MLQIAGDPPDIARSGNIQDFVRVADKRFRHDHAIGGNDLGGARACRR